MNHLVQQHQEFMSRFYAPRPQSSRQALAALDMAMKSHDISQLKTVLEQYRGQLHLESGELLRRAYAQNSIPFLNEVIQLEVSRVPGVSVNHFASKVFKWATRDMNRPIIDFLIQNYTIYSNLFAPLLLQIPPTDRLFNHLINHLDYDPSLITRLIIAADTQNNEPLIDRLLDKFPQILDRDLIPFLLALARANKATLLNRILEHHEIPDPLLSPAFVQAYDADPTLFTYLVDHYYIPPTAVPELFIRAMAKDDTSLVNLLVTQYPNNIPPDATTRILLQAAQKGHYDVVKTLLSQHEFPIEVLSKVLSSIDLAWPYDVDLVHQLIQAGARLMRPIDYTVLPKLAAQGDFETVKYLVDHHYYSDQMIDPYHALSEAIENNHDDIAKYLVEHALIPDGYPQNMLSWAIHTVVKQGNLPMLQYLLEQRHRMKPPSELTWTPQDETTWFRELLEEARKYNRPDSLIVEYLQSISPSVRVNLAP
jgi:ankyrin repeat protein